MKLEVLLSKDACLNILDRDLSKTLCIKIFLLYLILNSLSIIYYDFYLE